jgi:DNA polymerase III delta subunit
VKFAELKNALKDKIAPAYQMAGSDIFLINKSVELILGAANVDKLGVVQFDESARADEINLAVQNVSLFGGRSAAIVRGLDNTRVYLQPIKSDKDFEKVDCNTMSESLVVRLIMQERKFNESAATVLARICEYNFAAISNEMEKLVNFYADKVLISEDDINAIVTKTERYQVFELSNALLKRDIERVNAMLENFQANGTDDYAVFGFLAANARRLFYAKHSPLSEIEIAGHLGVHPYSIISIRREARNVSAKRSAEIFRRALELEYAIKGGRILANRAVVLLAGCFI